jgi:4-aminobutyrate aminotransferase-like enzyme
LFVGVEIVEDRSSKRPDPARAAAIVNRLKDKGFLTGAAGAFRNVVKIRPPLVFSHDDAALFLEAWDQVMLEFAE